MSFETGKFVAGGLLGLGIMTGGGFLIHDAFATDSANAKIAGCLEPEQAHKPVCQDVAIKVSSDPLREGKNSAEIVQDDSFLELLAGLGVAAVGAIELGYVTVQTCRD